MKAKNKINLNNSIAKVFDRANTLVNSLIELQKLKSKHIPDYSKGSKGDGLIIVGQGSEKEKIVTPNGNVVEFINKNYDPNIHANIIKAVDKASEHIFDNPSAKEEAKNHLVDTFKMAFEKGLIKFHDKKEEDIFTNEVKNIFYENGFRSGKSNYIEYWSKQLNEHLKSKSVDTSEPFAMAPINDIEFELERTENGIKEKYFLIDSKGNKRPIAPPLGFNHNFQKEMLAADKELQKVCNTRHVHKFDHEQRIYEEGSGQLVNVIKLCNCGEKSWYNKEEIKQKQKKCPHENIDVESYSYGFNTKTLAISTCVDCGLNLTLENHSKLKNRQLEIGKEIEKLRTEAREIKNSLKH